LIGLGTRNRLPAPRAPDERARSAPATVPQEIACGTAAAVALAERAGPPTGAAGRWGRQPGGGRGLRARGIWKGLPGRSSIA